jgi:SHS2 domain-containing protein
MSGRPSRSSGVGRALALLASGAQIVAAFLPWAADGRTAFDLGVRSLGAGSEQPTVALLLVVLAAIPAVPALIGDAGLPRGVSAAVTAALVIGWLAAGPDGALTSGVLVAIGATVGHLAGAALALGGPAEVAPRPRDSGDPRLPPPGSVNGAGRGGGVDGGEPEIAAATTTRTPPRPGYRLLDHTADIALEAWSPVRAGCFAAAVRGLVASFAEVDDPEPTDRHRIELEPQPPQDLLVELLDEVIYVMDTRRAVPVGGRLEDREDGGLVGELALVPVDAVRQVGAVPKAITYHQLRAEQRDDGWWYCHVTVDV